MLEASKILYKIKKIMGLKTSLELAKLLNVKPNTLSSWKKRNSLQFETIIELCVKHNIDLNELFADSVSKKNAISNSQTRVKMIEIGQYLEYFLNPKQVLQNTKSGVFPTTEPLDIAFQVASQSMSPAIPLSCYVLTKKVEVSQVTPQSIYVYSVQDKGLFLCRLQKVSSSNTLLFVSDNPNVINMEIEPCSIKEIFEVRALFYPNLDHLGNLVD